MLRRCDRIGLLTPAPSPALETTALTSRVREGSRERMPPEACRDLWLNLSGARGDDLVRVLDYPGHEGYE
jgi:hypothetical protein